MIDDTKIFILPTEPIGTNSVVIACGSDCVIFDPAGDVGMWIGWLGKNELTPISIYLTHGHYDHMLSVADLCENYSIPWHMNPADNAVVAGNNALGFLFGASRIKRPSAKCSPLTADTRLELFTGLIADVIGTPGHTPGGVCFYIPDLKLLISGDTLFSDTIGRTDLPFGNKHDLMASIARLKRLGLAADTHVIPGHGPDSTIGDIALDNEYWRQAQSGH